MERGVHDVDDAGWFFFSGGPGAPRYGGDPTKHAVDHDTETFVREVLQNANDQALDDDPVKVTFDLLTLSGADKAAFLDALQWNDGLGDHIQAVASSDNGRSYEDLSKRLDDPESELRLLVVEDENTTGLTGQWDEDSNFAALVRDELYSSKRDDRAGGSYGLGKSVLWTFSGASTVVFNSRLAEAEHETGARRRLIGRTKLPTHRLDDENSSYQGAGWLCRPTEGDNGTRPEAIWDDRAARLAERLLLDRPNTPGTSIMVVDYRDPTRDERRELEELADEFVEAAVKYFWPAIHRGDLEVDVKMNGEERVADVRDVPSIRPFLECFESRDADDTTLDAPGDVAGLDVPLSVPPRWDGEETPDGEVRLAARRASPADDDTLLNRVALFRGAGMVVKYLDQSRVAYGDRNFHAILACGEAKTDHGSTPGDREVERFLRYAEPPEHDDWQSTENLREQYQRGYRKALDEMFDTVRDGLRHLVAKTGGQTRNLTERVRDRFPIHGGRARSRPAPSPSTVFDMSSDSAFDGDRWRFSGHVEPVEDEFEGWTAEISLTGVGEDGARYDDVPIASVRSEHPDVTTDCEDGVARIVAGPDADAVRFDGESERFVEGGVRSGEIGETQLEIRAELETGGS
ncbi:hypothetical protein Hrd1104_00155 [Halorhabdus sp. CBA1104]|uniref:hypothetical protein n=1 Tax=Halorhabdus sp. CBA1104 TaxID=1380432 RepID=UPI0012B2567F|nr:hypothetical protein [Halorhabdus sp. CBA1104]QGN08137.1 hypothetical protein Hrd1104_00155 [Halorhabdus sp. CBA1104]